MHFSWISAKYLLWTGESRWWKIEGQTQLFKYREKCKGRMIATGREKYLHVHTSVPWLLYLNIFAKLTGISAQQYSEIKKYYLYGEDWGSERLKTSVRKTFISVLHFIVNGNCKLNMCLELCSIQTIILFSILRSS